MRVVLLSVIEEYRFKETLDSKMKNLKRNLNTVMCEVPSKFKTIKEEIEKYQVETLAECETYSCFKVSPIFPLTLPNFIHLTLISEFLGRSYKYSPEIKRHGCIPR